MNNSKTLRLYQTKGGLAKFATSLRILIALSLIVIGLTPAHAIDGLLGYWRFDEANGEVANDSSGNDNHGEIIEPVGAWVSDPERGSVYQSGNGSYVDMGEFRLPELNEATDFTWSFWVFPNETDNNNIVFGNRWGPDGADFAPREFIKFTPRKFEWHFDGGGQDVSGGETMFVVDEWSHNLVVKKGLTLTYYRNGEEVLSGEVTEGPVNPQPLYIGGQNGNEIFSGLFDEVAIFDRALDATEVVDVYQAGLNNDDLSQSGQVFDFNEDPMLDIISNTDTTEWRASGGVDDSGYLSLTDAVGGAQANIIFPPVENPISAFKFSVDARIGGDKDRPADGFSINIVRAEDPILEEPRGLGYAISHQFPDLGGLQEEGSQTGLGIGFDTWDNGQFQQEPEADIVGFSIRVDGDLVEQIPAATANGEPDDVTSLQTGPIGVEDPPIENLSWQRFEVELTEDRMLNINWKGQEVLKDFAVDWFPSENMQIVLGARTGGSWEAHHFDNLSLEVVTTNTARITNVDRSREGVSFTYGDSDESQLNVESLVLTIDGTEVEPTIDAADGVTTTSYQPEMPWAFGSEHPWVLTALDQNSLDIGATGVIKIATPLFPFGEALVGPGGIEGAFSTRYIWDAGTIGSMSKAIEFVQLADDAGFPGEVVDVEHEVIDHGSGGFFSNDFEYPEDVTGSDDWAAEDFIQLNKGNILITRAGDYTIGVQSDDGFGVRVHGMTFDEVNGAGRLDPLVPDAFYFAGTTGNSQTRGIARNVQPGVYPLEFLWFERGGGDYGEIFVAEGAFPLVEDTEEWALIGEGLPLVGGAIAGPEVQTVSVSDSVVIDFTTPSPESDHKLEMSTTLLSGEWQVIPDAVLTNTADLYTLTTGRPADQSSYYRVAMLPPPPRFSEDFESSAEGWTAVEPWELGTPAVDGLTEAHGGSNVYGTDLDDVIAGGLSASLRSPLIDLTGIGRPRLTFWHYHDSTEDAEGVQLKILDETGNSELYVHGDIFWGKTDEWTEFRLTIPENAREQSVMFEWLLLTADGGEAGFYLDDVEVD
ncbi:MAG: hypothetical protein GWQ05_28570 [Verrucomicrobiaceae bacterium]|nr:hypothetical protein [Verrucomicrobiaceae bacterium]